MASTVQLTAVEASRISRETSEPHEAPCTLRVKKKSKWRALVWSVKASPAFTRVANFMREIDSFGYDPQYHYPRYGTLLGTFVSLVFVCILTTFVLITIARANDPFIKLSDNNAAKEARLSTLPLVGFTFLQGRSTPFLNANAFSFSFSQIHMINGVENTQVLPSRICQVAEGINSTCVSGGDLGGTFLGTESYFVRAELQRCSGGGGGCLTDNEVAQLLKEGSLMLYMQDDVPHGDDILLSYEFPFTGEASVHVRSLFSTHKVTKIDAWVGFRSDFDTFTVFKDLEVELGQRQPGDSDYQIEFYMSGDESDEHWRPTSTYLGLFAKWGALTSFLLLLLRSPLREFYNKRRFTAQLKGGKDLRELTRYHMDDNGRILPQGVFNLAREVTQRAKEKEYLYSSSFLEERRRQVKQLVDNRRREKKIDFIGERRIAQLHEKFDTRQRRIKMAQLIVALLGIALVVVELQVAWDDDAQEYRRNAWTRFLKSLMLVDTLILMHLIYRYYKEKVILSRAESVYFMHSSARHPLWGTQLLWTFLLEEIVVFVHSFIFLDFDYNGKPILPDSVGLFMFFRLYLVKRVLRDISVVYRKRREIERRSLGRTTATAFTWKLVVKFWFYYNSVLLVATTWIASIFIMAFCMHVLERDEPTDREFTFKNSLWFTVVSMTTVGYGDFVPQSQLGRLITSVIMLMGVVFYSLFVSVISNKLRLGPDQRLAALMILDDKLRETETVLCARLIQCAWRLKMIRNNTCRLGRASRVDHLVYTLRFMRTVKELRVLRWRKRFTVSRESYNPLIMRLVGLEQRFHSLKQKLEDLMKYCITLAVDRRMVLR